MVKECCICGENAEVENTGEDCHSYIKYECKVCGNFIISIEIRGNIDKDKYASFLHYHNIFLSEQDKKKFWYLVSGKEVEKIQKRYPHNRVVTNQEIEDWYPQTFSEKINTILLGFSKLSKYDGSSIEMTHEQCCSAFFAKRYNYDNNNNESETTQEERNEQFEYIEDYLQGNKFVRIDKSSEKISITLLPDGLKRIEELQKIKTH